MDSIYFDDKFFNELYQKAKESPRLRMNYDLRNSVDDKSQRMFNSLEVGTKVTIHRHSTSSETVIIINGAVDEIFYDDNKNEIARYRLDPKQGKYGLQIPVGQWHGMDVIEPSTIIECKDGPYAVPSKHDILE